MSPINPILIQTNQAVTGEKSSSDGLFVPWVTIAELPNNAWYTLDEGTTFHSVIAIDGCEHKVLLGWEQENQMDEFGEWFTLQHLFNACKYTQDPYADPPELHRCGKKVRPWAK